VREIDVGVSKLGCDVPDKSKALTFAAKEFVDLRRYSFGKIKDKCALERVNLVRRYWFVTASISCLV
jgi:hypothetical protein